MSVLPLIAVSVFWLPYNLLVLWMLKKLKPTKDYIPSNISGTSIAVILVYRNEKQNLPRLIETLKNQTHNNCQFVLIDDHSDDGSKTTALSLSENDSRFIHLSLPVGIYGKKAAIEYAMSQVKAEFYLLTDADCRLSPHWVASMVTSLRAGNKALVSGTVLIAPVGKFLTKLQSVEMAYLVGMGHALIELKLPLLCNGASLGFNHTVSQLPMNNRFQSGDDVFRLHETAMKNLPIGYNNHPKAFVFTDAQPTFRHWFQQRVRWASKTIGYKPFYTRLLSAIIVLGQWNVLILPFFIPLKWWLLLVTGKLLNEIAFTMRVKKIYRQNLALSEILTIGLFYPIFTAMITLGTLFPLSWKGRKKNDYLS
ncbi:MAG TPA: glycosyltransferase [Salinivirgaceae bacterium]|nr:glycosyltransferase [Salinivirgaceae bacterium]